MQNSEDSKEGIETFSTGYAKQHTRLRYAALQLMYGSRQALRSNQFEMAQCALIYVC